MTTLEFDLRYLGGPLDVQQMIEFYEGRRMTYALARSFLEGQIATPGWHCRVAVADGAVIGFISYLIRTSSYDIQGLGVHPDYRRHGVASALLGEVRRKLDGRRPGITCGVPDSLLEMHLFLKAQGFTAFTVLRGDGEPDVYMFSYLDIAKEVAA